MKNVAYKTMCSAAYSSGFKKQSSPLLGIIKRYENVRSIQNLYINVHRKLFIIAKKSKQFKYPSVCEWVNKMWYIHKIE